MADDSKTHVHRRIKVTRPNAVLQGMARHPNICVFVVALVLTIIANYGDSFTSKQQVVMPPKQPQFFFPPQMSVVLDSSRGSLEPIVKRLQQDEFVFVMFYAPWCSKSVAARSEFEKAAVMLYNKVTFAAVNCWWPEGECSKRYKFLVFPSFLAYHTNLDGYRYFGTSRADHFVQFVDNLIHPLSFVHTFRDVQDKIARYDSLVLGFFNLMGNTHEGSYRQFYFASMRILERDPLQPVHFAVTANPSLGRLYQLAEQGIILIQAKNISLIYPFGTNITCTKLVNWAMQNKAKPAVSRLNSPGLKSQSLAMEINGGPAVIVFHHENPMFRADQGLRVVKEVALQYQSCLLNKDFNSLHLNWRKLALMDSQKLSKLSKMCQSLRKSNSYLKKSSPCCFSAVISKLKEHWCICDVCQMGGRQLCSIAFDNVFTSMSQSLLSISNCSTIAPSYKHTKQYNVCCHNHTHNASDDRGWMSENDKLFESLRNVLSDSPQQAHAYGDFKERHLTDRYYLDNYERLPRRLCDQFSYAKLNSPVFPQLEEENVFSVNPHLARELKGAGCRPNGTLNFFSMDSQTHWMFADRLGLDGKLSALSPSVVIFDKDAEEHYIMKENFTMSNTMSFIMNFQKGNLKRQQNSDVFTTSGCDVDGQACVQELDSKSFLPSVRTEHKDVVVLIYSHWCGFCYSVSHTFLSLAQYFGTSKYISFMRINGATNDLPWEYTVESFPKILFFPAYRKPDSIMFPSTKDKSLINLIRFVLSHSTYDTRLLLASDVCSKSCIKKNLHRSKALLQKLTLKYRKVFIRIHDVAESLSDVSRSQSYLRLSYEFLRKSVINLSERIKNVRLLIKYLESNLGGVISKDKLMALFQSQ